jgi:aldehyde dehydrogenase (NAD+)
VNDGKARDWMGASGEGHAFLEQATEIKTIWVPYGE